MHAWLGLVIIIVAAQHNQRQESPPINTSRSSKLAGAIGSFCCGDKNNTRTVVKRNRCK
jgi:hypothetical protein